MFPAFLDLNVDEVHLEMASREFAEIGLIGLIAERTDVAVGVIDVKSYYIETAADVADRVRRCLEHAPPERLAFAPDCGLSQTARWAARQKLANMVTGVHTVRRDLGLEKPREE
jgi:5-methyltetrahydropteroyltriglutamate--homocysteine methyltransferase